MADTQQSTPPKPSPVAVRFNELSARAKQAQANIAKATAESRTELSSQVTRARQATDASTAKLKHAATATQDKAAENWNGVQDRWHNLTANAHEKAEDHQADHDAKRAERRADRAERHAIDAIEFASAVVQESEYATLVAVLARMDADDAALVAH